MTLLYNRDRVFGGVRHESKMRNPADSKCQFNRKSWLRAPKSLENPN